MRSAVTTPIRRITQQRPFAKPPATTAQQPAYQTVAPQYRRPTRRLADVPRSGFGKAGQEASADQEEDIDAMLKRLQDEESSRAPDSKGDLDDDLSGLERDDDDELQGGVDELTKLALEDRSIRQIRPFLSYALEGIDKDQLPERLAEELPNETYTRAERQPIAFHWMASNLHHNPLYFEDPALERYGHSYHPMLQPFASAGRMTTQLIGLPYQMTIDPIHRRRYSLGWIRPGDCAPKLKYRVPFNKKAALVQGAAMAVGIAAAP
ncbi:MAG: hypothetical protein AB8G99_17220 [Planctomycetaceae bacterium]